MGFKTTSGKAKQRIASLLALLLLALYVIGTSPVALIHEFAHDHQVLVTHSQEQEKDPCHRLVYHNDVEAGCDHDVHLTASDTCQMCDLAYHGDQTLLLAASYPVLKFSDQYFDGYKVSLDAYWAIRSSSRAPPVLS